MAPKIILDEKNGKLILSTSPWNKITLTTTGRIYSPWYVRSYGKVSRSLYLAYLGLEHIFLNIIIYLLGYRKGDDE
jgi:hypothetical protein